MSPAGYYPMSIKRLGGRTGESRHVSSSPLKFRTVGFPQYGFKLDISHGDLRQRAALPFAQDPHRHCDTTDSYAITRPPRAPLWSWRTSCRGPLPGRLQSSGPWLTSGFCCPTRSSLVGSEVAHKVSLTLATVRRSNCTCGFPAYSFHEDSFFRDAIEGIN